MTDSDCLAQFDYAAVRQEFARQNAQKRRFARAVAADDADAVAAENAVGKITEDRAAVVTLRDMLQRDDFFAETARGRRKLYRAVAFGRFAVL